MNEFDRKKFVVYEQSLARFVDYLRKYSYEIKEEIHGNRSYIKSNSDDLSGLIDMSEKIESDLKQIHIDLNHQNSNMDQFRTEIRTSLERGFTELRERIKLLGKEPKDEINSRNEALTFISGLETSEINYMIELLEKDKT